MFQSVAMRPSPTSAVRAEIDNFIQTIDASDGMRNLIEKAFYLLLNIDQRLERLEEEFLKMMFGKKEEISQYEWVAGEVGAGGIAFRSEGHASVKQEDMVLLDILLPDLPEQRIVAAGKVREMKPESQFEIDFLSIHSDDREFIHRFVMARQREILRERSMHKHED